MNAIRNVCVYCGSGDGADPRFAAAAEALGRSLAAEGIGLVYGGGGDGLMGRLARATLEGGGFVTGIIPSFLVRKEHALTEAQEMLVVETMHERKRRCSSAPTRSSRCRAASARSRNWSSN